ncbi:AraC family transcriptional regulator [Pseudomonas abieticivorans]|uniref:AraC family transcriptional regulator n=1 Tax=Pseudomonas abieticivorans TaxID=2931382 RepID=UPI0024BF052F|nr:AraC family transcriptional regulator [Pseudomonas sp. PIA16]
MMESQLLGERSQVFAHADPHAVSDYVNRHVGNHCIVLPRRGQPLSSLNHKAFASLDLCRISYGASVRVTSHALETIYHLQVLLRGHCVWRSAQGEQCLGPGELLVINPHDPVDLTYSADCEKFILKVPTRLLEAVCEEQRWHTEGAGVRFVGNRYRLDQLDGFDRLLGMLCNEAESRDPLLRVQEHYAQIVASKMLTAMPSNLRREASGSAAMTFERIADYIQRHLKHAIDSNALAKVANMSQRSLYALFERHAGTTPGQYIRQQKLQRIQACLKDPACNVRNVTELALDYGFAHLGRFAEQYRQAFGELPSHTLQQRRCA